MLCQDIIAVSFEMHTKYMYTNIEWCSVYKFCVFLPAST